MKLPLQSHTHSPSGSYGSYIQLTKTKGIKIFDRGKFESKEQAKNDFLYDEAKEEKAFYDHLHSKGCDFVPRCYHIAFIKIGEYWRIGLVLQHLGTVRMKDKISDYTERWALEKEMREKLKTFGVSHRDIHAENIMFFEDKFWVIDFGSRYCDYID